MANGGRRGEKKRIQLNPNLVESSQRAAPRTKGLCGTSVALFVIRAHSGLLLLLFHDFMESSIAARALEIREVPCTPYAAEKRERKRTSPKQAQSGSGSSPSLQVSTFCLLFVAKQPNRGRLLIFCTAYNID
jgi:hypothetical protein